MMSASDSRNRLESLWGRGRSSSSPPADRCTDTDTTTTSTYETVQGPFRKTYPLEMMLISDFMTTALTTLEGRGPNGSTVDMRSASEEFQ